VTVSRALKLVVAVFGTAFFLDVYSPLAFYPSSGWVGTWFLFSKCRVYSYSFFIISDAPFQKCSFLPENTETACLIDI